MKTLVENVDLWYLLICSPNSQFHLSSDFRHGGPIDLGLLSILSLISAAGSVDPWAVTSHFAKTGYIGIAVLLFPLLKLRFESLALAYVGFRVVEFITQIVADVSPLALLTLAGDTGQAGTVQGLGALLLAERFWAFQMLNLIFSLSALLLYAITLRSRLIPGFISIWGLIAAALVLVNTVLGWFRPELGESLGMITGLPMLMNEVFLGIWLIVRGFNQPETAFEPAKQLALEV